MKNSYQTMRQGCRVRKFARARATFEEEAWRNRWGGAAGRENAYAVGKMPSGRRRQSFAHQRCVRWYCCGRLRHPYAPCTFIGTNRRETTVLRETRQRQQWRPESSRIDQPDAEVDKRRHGRETAPLLKVEFRTRPTQHHKRTFDMSARTMVRRWR